MGVRSDQEGAGHTEQKFSRRKQGQQKGEERWSGQLRVPATPFHSVSLCLNGFAP